VLSIGVGQDHIHRHLGISLRLPHLVGNCHFRAPGGANPRWRENRSNSFRNSRKRTSVIPALLLTAVTFCASVIFSGFGFFKHYAYAEGNRVTDFGSTSAQVRTLAMELERYRTDALASAATEIRRLEDERRRQDAKVNNPRLTPRLRSMFQVKRDQLARQIARLTKTQAAFTNLNVMPALLAQPG